MRERTLPEDFSCITCSIPDGASGEPAQSSRVAARFPMDCSPVNSRFSDQTRELLAAHIERLHACRRCPRMHKPVVSGGPVLSRVLLVGQAPGDKEPVLGRPFAWTAGKTLFHWFEDACGLNEQEFRARIYMAAVCRCFPGKKPQGGDRVPSAEEIGHCSSWLDAELEILGPRLVIPVGKLAIQQFLPFERIDRVIGRKFEVRSGPHRFSLIPLPHPSGASPWHRMEPGKMLLDRALKLIGKELSDLSKPALVGKDLAR
jgi:uracil-DNA glycosylase